MTTRKGPTRHQQSRNFHSRKAELKESSTSLQDGDKDWNKPCSNCGEFPTVFPTGLCGPCCWGEAETFGGNW